MTFHRNVRSFGANNQVQGWEKQVFLAQPIWQVQGKVNRNSENHRWGSDTLHITCLTLSFLSIFYHVFFCLFVLHVYILMLIHFVFSQLLLDMAYRVLVKWPLPGACPRLLTCRAWSPRTEETIQTWLSCPKTEQDGRTSRNNPIKRGVFSLRPLEI